jgi:hypothetical protein
MRLRVQTAFSIDEPVVSVQVAAGCTSRVTRRFVIFADPPQAAPAPMAVPEAMPALPLVVASAAGVTIDGRVAGDMAAAGALMASASAPAAAAASPLDIEPAAPAAGSAAPARPATQAPAPAPRSSAAAPAQATAPRPRPAQPPAAPRPRPAPAPVVAAAPAPAATGGARLRLEAPEPPPSAEAQMVEAAIQAVAEATNAARLAATTAQQQAQRIAELERSMAQLRTDASGAARENAELRARITAAEGAGRWTMPLALGVLVLGAMAGWLAWRVNSLQKLRQANWRAVDGVATARAEAPVTEGTAPIPFVTSEIGPAQAAPPALRPRSAPAWPPPAPNSMLPPPATEPAPLPTAAAVAGPVSAPAFTAAAEPVPPASRPALEADDLRAALAGVQRTQPLPVGAVPQDGAPRDVSIEELIDLEQQAEFFIVLGQEDSAIDLLVEHLRSTGGGSPLPYLKLLEIYGRRGDREAYERTRSRFNHRFNAYAPEWGSDLARGRTLEDYPEVLPRLQQVWPQPLDAMAELEALLFRKSRGELFELPAYREVLFLYALARDLLDREAGDTGNVDLLLPLADGAGMPQRRAADDTEPGAFDDRPTAPVDLDLSLGDVRASLFDPLRPTPRG